MGVGGSIGNEGIKSASTVTEQQDSGSGFKLARAFLCGVCMSSPAWVDFHSSLLPQAQIMKIR